MPPDLINPSPATCSFDRTATIWEEVSAGGDPGQEHGGSSSESSSSSWVKRTSLVDSRTSVTDVKFAPKHLGLQLATCSSDGMVRIYEAPDVMNLSQWSPQLEINSKMSCSCIAWNPSRAHLPMIAGDCRFVRFLVNFFSCAVASLYESVSVHPSVGPSIRRLVVSKTTL